MGVNVGEKKSKIVFLPLDERPCNYYFPQIMPLKGLNLCVPPQNLMGDKKDGAEFAPLKGWLLSQIKDAECLILSMDMLLYGGIVPSRLHRLKEEKIKERIDLVRIVKELNPKLTIYAFQLIMRCPWYSSDDEEPNYYKDVGAEIHQLGRLTHLKNLGAELDAADQKLLCEIQLKLPKSHLDDYLTRREKNTNALVYALELVIDGTVDYFVVPQDDSAPLGWTAMDQIKIRGYIKQNSLHMRAAIYPGADEVGLTLLSRFISKSSGAMPKIFVHYASHAGGAVIPSFEDRPVDETVKYQIAAAGGVRVYSLPEADIALCINIGGDMAGIDDKKNAADYDVMRNLTEFVHFIKYALSQKKAVAVGDTAYANGGDIELVKLLQAEGLLYKINSYAGWNTSSNTLGTAICQAVASVYAKDENANELFLTHRYIEDVCYCGFARRYVIDNHLPALGLNYFDAGGKTGRTAEIVKKIILDFCKDNLPDVYGRIGMLMVEQPWARMFETFVKVTAKGKRN